MEDQRLLLLKDRFWYVLGCEDLSVARKFYSTQRHIASSGQSRLDVDVQHEI